MIIQDVSYANGSEKLEEDRNSQRRDLSGPDDPGTEQGEGVAEVGEIAGFSRCW